VGIDERVVEKWRRRRELDSSLKREQNLLPPIRQSPKCSFSFGFETPDGIHFVDSLQSSGHRPLGNLGIINFSVAGRDSRCTSQRGYTAGSPFDSFHM
jgi:hypothetical protein